MKKNKNLFKCIAILILLSMISILMIGCGESREQTSQDKNKIQEERVQEEKVQKEEINIVIWHYLNDRDELMKEFAKEYEQKTGVKVDFQLYSGDQMGAKIQAATQAKTLPDAWTGVGLKPALSKLVEGGYISKLNDFIPNFEGWSTKFPKNILEQVSFTKDDGFNVTEGTYGVPLDVNNMQFLYNKELFKKAGLDPEKPPKTWNEFLDYGKKLKAAGITPFATGIGTWVGFSLIQPYIWAYIEENTLKEASAGKISFKDAGFEKVLNLLVEMRDAGMFAEGVATMDLPTAEQMFVNGQVAMIFDGSWAIGVFNSMNPNFKDYGVFFPPKDDRAPYEVLIPGGIGAYFVVNKDSKYLKETVDFLVWLTEKEQQVKYANESFNLPANREAIDPNKLLSQTAEFAKEMDKVSPGLPPIKNPRAEEVLGKGIQLIVIGQKTPTDVVKEMDEANK